MLNKYLLFIPLGALSLSLLSCSLAYAQTLTLSGTVRDEMGRPLENATVYLHETLQSGLTDSSGRFQLSGIRPGDYHVHVQMIGYEKMSLWVHMSESNQRVEVTIKERIGQLQEVIIEADRNKLSDKESSQPIIQVGAEFIQRNNGNTLMESLEKLPGISSINTGVGVSKPVIRGLSFQRVMVVDQGIKQEGQQWGADHGLEIDQYGVENIEIIKGPGSLLYGSDAIGGVISIGKPGVLQEGVHQSEGRMILKTNNHTYGASGSVKGNHGGWVYLARVTGLSYGDYQVPADTFYYQDTYFPLYNGRLKNTAGKELHAHIMTGIHRKWGYSHLMVSNYHQQVGLFTGAIGRVSTDRLVQDEERNIDLAYQRINHLKIVNNTTVKMGRGWVELDLGYQHNDRQEHSIPHTHGQPLPDNNTLALRLGLHSMNLSARYYIPVRKHQTFVMGGQLGLQQNKQNGFEFLIPAYRSQQAGIFVLHKYQPVPGLFVHSGLRVETARQHADRSVYPIYRRFEYIDSVERNGRILRTHLNYAAAIGISLEINDRLHFKLNTAKSYRLPVIAELSANGMHHATFRFEKGNPNLRAEEGYQIDAELRLQTAKWKLQLSPFTYYFSNYIFQRPTGLFPRVEIGGALYALPSTSQVFEYTQTEALFRGQEMEAEWSIGKRWKLSQTIEMVWAENLSTGLPLPFIPPATFYSGIAWHSYKKEGMIRKVYIEGTLGIVQAQNRVERNEWASPGYQVVHFSAGFSVYRKQQEFLQVSFQCRNATNALYFNHLSRYRLLNLPEPGRNFIVKLSWKLEKKEKGKI